MTEKPRFAREYTSEHLELVQIKYIEHDFAAVITPGLRLAFLDRQEILLSGETIFGEKAQRPIWVSGPGAFVVLRALAFRMRGENKDAYDLYYHIRNYGTGAHQIADAMKKVLGDEKLQLEMREKGFERSKIFSWEKCAVETLEIFKQMVTEK